VAAASREWAAAVAGYAEAAFRAGQPERVLPYLWQWAAADPLHEKAHAMLMVALAASGQQAAALDVFAEVRERLDAQLGVRPGPAHRWPAGCAVSVGREPSAGASLHGEPARCCGTATGSEVTTSPWSRS
jgi:hypothetical protein